jgi:hypothetical protein
VKVKRTVRIAALLVSLTLALAGAGMAAGIVGGNSGNQGIVEINTHDYKSEHKVGFSIVHLQGDTVDNKNAAYAQSSGCTYCNSTAIAVQVVLVQDNNVTTVVPQNFAFGVNQQCSYCTSAGLAYQYAISTNGIVHFSAQGNQELSDLRNQIDAQAASIIDDPIALRAAVSPLVHQMWSVVDDELVHSGAKYDATPYADFQSDTTGGGASPSASVSASPSASDSPSATPSPSPSTPPSLSATATPASSPSDTGVTSPTPSSGGSGSPTPSDSSSPSGSGSPSSSQSTSSSSDPSPSSGSPSPSPSSSP